MGTAATNIGTLGRSSALSASSATRPLASGCNANSQTNTIKLNAAGSASHAEPRPVICIDLANAFKLPARAAGNRPPAVMRHQMRSPSKAPMLMCALRANTRALPFGNKFIV